MLMRCIFCVLSSMVAMTLVVSLANGQDLPPLPETPAIPTAPQAVSPNTKTQVQNKTKVVYKEKSYYDFEDVLINGNVRAPDGSFIFRKSDSEFSSALRLKRSFIPELKDSATSAR